MKAEERRALIVDELASASEPFSGGALADAAGVSRQVIVQDIALLRAQGHRIVSTNRGYVLEAASSPCERLIKVKHTVEQTADELEAIVDAGGAVRDVMVNHRVYGRISAPLDIKTRRDAARFVADMESGASSLLLTVTSGYHFHHVAAESEEVLDEIEAELARRGYLAEFLPYERTGA